MGRRGPKPTPTAQLKLVGSRQLEQRRDEPQPELGAPNPPTWLCREALSEWKRVERSLPCRPLSGFLRRLLSPGCLAATH